MCSAWERARKCKMPDKSHHCSWSPYISMEPACSHAMTQYFHDMTYLHTCKNLQLWQRSSHRNTCQSFLLYHCFCWGYERWRSWWPGTRSWRSCVSSGSLIRADVERRVSYSDDITFYYDLKWSDMTQCNTIQRNTVQYSTVQYSTVQYDIMEFNIPCNTTQHSTELW